MRVEKKEEKEEEEEFWGRGWTKVEDDVELEDHEDDMDDDD